MTYESTVIAVKASNFSTLDDSYDGDDTCPIRGIALAAVGGAIFWGTCFAVWHYFL